MGRSSTLGSEQYPVSFTIPLQRAKPNRQKHPKVRLIEGDNEGVGFVWLCLDDSLFHDAIGKYHSFLGLCSSSRCSRQEAQEDGRH